VALSGRLAAERILRDESITPSLRAPMRLERPAQPRSSLSFDASALDAAE
jgi:hypothetical protein